MKILLLNYEFPPLGGGAGNATRYIARELTTLGHQVTVVTTWIAGQPDTEIFEGYEVVRLHSRRARRDQSNTVEMFSYVFHAVMYLERRLRRERFDHCISFFALPTGLAAWYLKIRFKLKYVASLRGGDVPGFMGKELQRLHALTMPLTRMVWRGASSVVANSEGLRELAQKTGDRIDVQVKLIPNGVDTSLFRPLGNVPISSAFNLLFVGRLSSQKGVTFLLKALGRIKSENPAAFGSITCTLIGDGPLRHDLEKEATDVGITDHVSFRGWIDRSALPKQYSESSVFVLPTLDEGMPNVLLEAMACGLPIIATNVAGNNELVKTGVNGILIEKPTDLADAILELKAHPEEMAAYGAASRKEAERRGWDAVADEYVRLMP